MSTRSSIDGVENREVRPTAVAAENRQSASTLGAPTGSPSSESANGVGHGSQSASGLLSAFELIARRGAGRSSWAAPLGDDPIAFLLDSISDAANLWSASGSLLCRNRASIALGSISAVPPPSPGPGSAVEGFSVQDHRYERRYLHCRMRARDYVLEVVREVTHS